MKDFIPYEQALELKELGFDEPCGSIYDKDGNLQRSLLEYPIINSKNGFHECWNIITAPLYQQAFRWFREKFDLRYKFEPSKEGTVDIFIWHIVGWEYFKNILESEAELACLKKLIEIVK